MNCLFIGSCLVYLCFIVIAVIVLCALFFILGFIILVTVLLCSIYMPSSASLYSVSYIVILIAGCREINMPI